VLAGHCRMPVAIQAKILHRSVFFSGETVQCQILFTYLDPVNNHGTRDDKLSIEHNHIDSGSPQSIPEDITVAWASAQIYCQCHIDESRVNSVNNIKGQHQFPGNVTSFIPTSGETGYCFMSTKPVILFCNLKLQRGKTKTVNFSDDIPVTAPPSYQGHALRFSYKITIGIGTIKGPTKLIRLPLRVLSTEGLLVDKQELTATCSSRNPFLDDIESEDHSLCDVLVDRLTFLTSQRNKNVYNISCSQGCAGKFSLSKSYFRIGEDLQGSFDFTDAAVKCMKYKVSLQSVEEVVESFRKPGSKQKTIHTTYSRCEECCLNSRQTNFCLPIPITATPEFSSKIVSVRWRLHCEVMTSVRSDLVSTDERDNGGTASNFLENRLRRELRDHIVPKNIKIESMTWDIPVQIVASNPNQISLSLSNNFPVSVLL